MSAPNSIQGPAIFLAQFIRPQAPFDTLDGLCRWAAGLGYKGVQVPAWESPRLIDLPRAAESPAYCDDWRARLSGHGLVVTELNAALAGQVMAIHPAYAAAFQPFYPQGLDDAGRVAWASEQLRLTLRAAARLGTQCVPVLSGGLAWHLTDPWPQRPAGLVDEAFRELTRRWRPVLDLARDLGLTLGFELHRAPISSTAIPSSASSPKSAITPPPASTTIRAISCSSNSTTSNSSGSTARASAPSM